MSEKTPQLEEDSFTEEELQDAEVAFREMFGEPLVSWSFPEYERHERGKWWYLLTFLALAALLVWAIVTLNYLLAIILIIFTFIVTMHHYQEPQTVEFFIRRDNHLLENSDIDRPHRQHK